MTVSNPEKSTRQSRIRNTNRGDRAKSNPSMATKEKESIEKWQQRDGHGGSDHEEDEWSCTDLEDYSCSEVNSDDDPSYDPSGDAGARFSALSIDKASITMGGEKPAPTGLNGRVADVAKKKADGVGEWDIVDTVKELVEAGQLEKLKVEQCKDYLRRNGLRLTGNKETLIQRIREHYEMMAGEGERKYPMHSFVINCKGDACIGDVVIFEQNVYDHYSIVSRSATAPPCGKRVVAGRIVKESYGALKQQHTFTIEVLWSKGEKPLPPLHPLLIKGRNLYRFRTSRQRWEDEEQRQRILMEKHSRGDVARSDREARLQDKERRNTRRANRKPKTSQPKISLVAEEKTDNKDPHLAASVANLVQASKPNPQDCYGKIRIPHRQPGSFQEIHQAKPHQLGFRNLAPTQCHPDTAASSLCLTDRRPLASMNMFLPNCLQGLNHGRKRQFCRYFEQGRCYFGDHCKFLHQYSKEQVQHRP